MKAGFQKIPPIREHNFFHGQWGCLKNGAIVRNLSWVKHWLNPQIANKSQCRDMAYLSTLGNKIIYRNNYQNFPLPLRTSINPLFHCILSTWAGAKIRWIREHTSSTVSVSADAFFILWHGAFERWYIFYDKGDLIINQLGAHLICVP